MLLLINGAPGVGKSTLAQHWADERPLALIVDVDALRMQLGQWEAREESRLVARDLALALVGRHLRAGHDVVVAQYLGRPEFRTRLQEAAAECGATFAEVVLTDVVERIAERFRARRAALMEIGVRHPEADLVDAAIDAELRRANAALVADAETRGVPVVRASGGVAAAYRQLRAAIDA